MNIIAAADMNWGIGKDGELLDNIPEDMKFFRETTTGKAVIMGKNTFLSFPNKKPLPKRLNIILTHDADFKVEGAVICKNIEDAVAAAKEKYKDEDIFFIGGESVYREAVNYCDTAYITRIEKSYTADRFIPDFENLDGWHKKSENRIKIEKGIYINFTEYKKNNE